MHEAQVSARGPLRMQAETPLGALLDLLLAGVVVAGLVSVYVWLRIFGVVS
jgi:hypothetical protein